MPIDDPTEGDLPTRKAPAKSPLPDPQNVLHDEALSFDEKIDKLRRWSQDAREVETANDEGMRGVVLPSNLPDVQDALRHLDALGTSATDDRPTAEPQATDDP